MKKLALSFLVQVLLLAVGRAATNEVVFASYNLANYFITERRDETGRRTSAAKPPKEIEALIQIIKEINPDILGVCEMGSKQDFEDFKRRLKDVGLGYTDFEYVEGADPERHLALASRFPITARQSLRDVPFEIGGKQEKVRRGFLDVTVQVSPDYHLRLVGAHLKSKLAAPEGEALLRRNEAHLLRGHVQKILAKDPGLNLVVYGDFNDVKNEPTIREIMGPKGAPDHLTDLWLKDNVGDRWTHYWKVADLYSRIDFIFVSRALMPEIIVPKCYVHRSDRWNDASDHRPVVGAIQPVNKP